MADALNLAVGGAALRLYAARAVYLPDLRCLLVADAHFGKAQSFRRLGVPVPGGTTADNLARLDGLISSAQPERLVFLGDLLHAPTSLNDRLDEAFRRWRLRHAGLALSLVRGNHDARAGDPPPGWGIEVVDGPWLLGPWALCHQPTEHPGGYALAGHLHPVAAVGGGIDRVRLPCFHFGPRVGVLPAFGAFTGGVTVRPVAGDTVVAVGDGHLHPLPARATPAL